MLSFNVWFPVETVMTFQYMTKTSKKKKLNSLVFGFVSLISRKKNNNNNKFARLFCLFCFTVSLLFRRISIQFYVLTILVYLYLLKVSLLLFLSLPDQFYGHKCLQEKKKQKYYYFRLVKCKMRFIAHILFCQSGNYITHFVLKAVN